MDRTGSSKCLSSKELLAKLGVDLKSSGDVIGDADDDLDFELSDSSTEISSADLSGVNPTGDSESVDLLGDSSEFTFDESGSDVFCLRRTSNR